MRADVAIDEVVSIWCRCCHTGGSNHAAGASNILEDDRMAQEFGEAVARIRPYTSPVPPAAKGTTMVSGREGHSCAVAVPSAAKMAANASPKGAFVIAGRPFKAGAVIEFILA